MDHQNEKKKNEWISSTVVLLMDSREERQKGQPEHFAAIALDILVRKLLEVQKENFTKDSYDLLQHAIFNAIGMKSTDIAQASDGLIIAAGKLQTSPLLMHSPHPYNYINKVNPIQNTGSVLRNTLQAILFNVQRFPYNEMTDRSVKQIKQTIQFAKETIDQNATTHELVFALRSVLGSLMDIQLPTKKMV
ncbi:hypothetical protein MKZ25_04120 [Solibacillus sp. FSL W7-1464]|uniref:hypothetical protein n=1 Tax=Solibacillus sp. FSL W7-1464 TaxID=2921706 RepID=UPI0030FC03C9